VVGTAEKTGSFPNATAKLEFYFGFPKNFRGKMNGKCVLSTFFEKKMNYRWGVEIYFVSLHTI